MADETLDDLLHNSKTPQQQLQDERYSDFAKYAPAEAELPKGYIAPGADAFTNAVPSDVLRESRHAHLLLSNGGPLGMDKEVELLLVDPRLDRILEKAETWKAQFNNPDSKDYIKDATERQKHLTHLTLDAIGEEYGSYRPSFEFAPGAEKKVSDAKHALLEPLYEARNERDKVVGAPGSSPEAKAEAEKKFEKAEDQFREYLKEEFSDPTKFSAKLSEYKKDELVCAQQGAIASIVLDAAGVPNHFVSSAITWTKMEDSVPKVEMMTVAAHAYVLIPPSKDSDAAVVEATAAGLQTDGKQASGYFPVLNEKTVQDIVLQGESIIVHRDGYSQKQMIEFQWAKDAAIVNGESKLRVYGGSDENGTYVRADRVIDPVIFNKQDEALEYYRLTTDDAVIIRLEEKKAAEEKNKPEKKAEEKPKAPEKDPKTSAVDMKVPDYLNAAKDAGSAAGALKGSMQNVAQSPETFAYKIADSQSPQLINQQVGNAQPASSKNLAV